MGRRVWVLVTGLLFVSVARGQLVEEFDPPKAGCCLAWEAKAIAEQLQDWNQLGRYHAADEALRKQPVDAQRVVFLGDSITDMWKLEESFPGKPFVNRGISGQTTEQMLVRMYPDVIDLKPSAVVILAGTNDIARNTGPETFTIVQENLMAMTELAQKHGIKVILCSVTPISDYATEPGEVGDSAKPTGVARRKIIQSVERPPAQILKLNEWIKSYAASVGAIYVDYFSALVDGNGMLKDGYSEDGLHPNAKGYRLMAPLVEALINKTLE